jgi:hypothetical protein
MSFVVSALRDQQRLFLFMGYNGMKEYAKVKDGRDFVNQINEKTKGTLMRRLSQHQMRREQDVVQTMRNL